MAALDTQTLLAQANCFACFGEVDITQALKLVLLSRVLISLSPAADVSPSALLAYAKCYNCFSTANLGDLMELALLDQISQAV